MEEEIKRLEQWLSTVMSDSDVEPFQDSSDSYNVSSSSNSSEDLPPKKKKKKHYSAVPSTSSRAKGESIPIPSTSSTCAESSLKQTETKIHTPPAIEESIENVLQNLQWSDTSSDELAIDLQWNDVTGSNLKHFPEYTENFNIHKDVRLMKDKSPADFFFLFVDDELLNVIVQQTNLYASQNRKKTTLPWARIRSWKDTNIEEMKLFIGLLLWIGLVQMPKLTCYWSNNVLYSNEVKLAMSRNRFELLLANWHFSNNEDAVASDGLYKIKPILENISKKFKEFVIPSRNVYVGETNVSFPKRLSLLEYIKNKKHNFEIKLISICLEEGYTYGYKLYCGAEKNTVPTIVMELCKNVLDCGRTIYSDNYCTSIELAHKLLERQTHLVGTLKKNQRRNPRQVINKKLRKGESVAKESDSGVIVIKWCDKREVLLATTKHKKNMLVSSNKQQPEAIKDYNQIKTYHEKSEQIKAYASCLRKSVKWYRKIIIKILLASTVLNAFILYKRVTGKTVSITQFREEITRKLLRLDNRRPGENSAQRGHTIKEVTTNNRRRCVRCYKELSEHHGRQYATSKATNTRYKCIQCDKFYCIHCFTEAHFCTLLDNVN